MRAPKRLSDHTRMKIGCATVLAVVLAAVVWAGWWFYRNQWPQHIEIRNETGQTVLVRGGQDADTTCNVILVAAGSSEPLNDSWLCHRPVVWFESPDIGAISCDWSTARRRQPIIIKTDSVSCHPGTIPKIYSPPAFPWPTPTPKH